MSKYYAYCIRGGMSLKFLPAKIYFNLLIVFFAHIFQFYPHSHQHRYFKCLIETILNIIYLI